MPDLDKQAPQVSRPQAPPSSFAAGNPFLSVNPLTGGALTGNPLTGSPLVARSPSEPPPAAGDESSPESDGRTPAPTLSPPAPGSLPSGAERGGGKTGAAPMPAGARPPSSLPPAGPGDANGATHAVLPTGPADRPAIAPVRPSTSAADAPPATTPETPPPEDEAAAPPVRTTVPGGMPPQAFAAYRNAGSQSLQDGPPGTPQPPGGATPPARPANPGIGANADAGTGSDAALPAEADPLAAAPSPAAEEPVFEAVVARNSDSGRPLLQTPFGLLSLDTAADLQPGSRISLQTIGPPTLPDPFDKPAAAAEPTAPFSGLQAFLASLGEDPGAPVPPGPGVAPAIPVPARLAAALVNLFLMADSGEVRPWLNQTALLKTLSKHEKLVAELEKEAGGLKTSVRMPDGDNWQSILVPLPIGQRIEQIRLMVRQRDEGETPEMRRETGTRFLVDLTMTRLGSLQLDGLMRPKSRRFDLILRTSTPLPEGVRRDIADIFRKSLDGMGMSGNASFQASRFIEPLAGAAGDGSGWVI